MIIIIIVIAIIVVYPLHNTKLYGANLKHHASYSFPFQTDYQLP